MTGSATATRRQRGDRRPVAVTAAAVLSPLADELDGFTAALLAGRSAVALPPSPAHQPADPAEQPLPVAQFVDFSLDRWAERHFPDEPEVAVRLRRVAGRAALPARTAGCVALRAARDAGLPPGGAGGWGDDSALVIAGSNLALAHQAAAVLGHQAAPARLRASYALTHLDADAVGVVSELTGITGEGWTTGSASASGTIALIQAARLVAAGWVERVLVVAPAAELSPTEVEAFRRTGAMAYERFRDCPAGMCRPFDRDRQGFVRGEAAAAVVLERPEAAAARGVAVLAEITGYGQRLDGRRGTEPDAAGQAAAMRAALDAAGLTPDQVDYVNAHGTGSVLGDSTEAASLRQVFAGCAPLVNSTKPLVGHCLSAAGLVEAVAVIAQLQAGACHPNPNLDDPIDPALGLVGTTAVARPLRTALSNSFAFGGINASVVLRLPDAGYSAVNRPSPLSPTRRLQ